MIQPESRFHMHQEGAENGPIRIVDEKDRSHKQHRRKGAAQ